MNPVVNRTTSREASIRRLLATAVVVLAVAALAGPARAARRTPFGVQTGSFHHLEPAVEQFARLSELLTEELRDELRVVKLGRYFAVRFGSFHRFREGLAGTKLVAPLAADAFVFNESVRPVDHLLLLYPDISGSRTPFVVEAGRFENREPAENRLQFVRASLPRDDLPKVRIEKGAGLHTVQIGPFRNLDRARRVRRSLKPVIPEVRITTAGRHGLAGTPAGEGSEEASPAQPVKDDVPENSELARDVTRPISRIEDEMERLLDQQEYGLAVEVIKTAIERWPDNPELYAWYGTTLLEMDRPDKALEHYRKAAELAPAVPDYQSNMGYSLYEMHLSSARESMEAFAKALRIDPENADALEGLGSVYVSIGEKSLAENVREQLKEIDPDAAARLEQLIRSGVDWNR